VLVFTATRLGANRLAYQLNRDHVHATAIHGDKSQPERLQALADFKSGKVGVLVATDVAARGLDIVDLPHVINFDLPNSPDDYVHRIGRTGRAGSTGEAISLVCAEEHERLALIERTLRLSIKRELVPGFEPDAMAVSSLIEPRRARGGQNRAPERGAVERERPRSPESTARGKAADPIFDTPYTPSAGTGVRAQPAAQPPGPARPVAALLGGVRATRK